MDWVESLSQILGFADDPPGSTPWLPGPVAEVAEDSRRLAGPSQLLHRLFYL
jgi:hypothetical protein